LSKNEAKRPENFKLTPFKQEIFIGAHIIIWHNHFTIYIFRKAIYKKRHIGGGTMEMSPCYEYISSSVDFSPFLWSGSKWCAFWMQCRWFF